MERPNTWFATERKFTLTRAHLRLAQPAMAKRDTSVTELCKDLGVCPVTFYRYVGRDGEFRGNGEWVVVG